VLQLAAAAGGAAAAVWLFVTPTRAAAAVAAAGCCWHLLYECLAAWCWAAYDAFCIQPGIGEGFIKLLQGIRQDARQLLPVKLLAALGAAHHREPCRQKPQPWQHSQMPGVLLQMSCCAMQLLLQLCHVGDR
jgi:hypothetical protein